MSINNVHKFISIKGVTLVEVLVAIVITSIGILGFASLQFLGVNSNQSAYSRSQASFIAADLSERMRANIEGMNGNSYAGFTSTTLNCGAVPGNFCDERNNAGTAVGAAACTAAQRAANDLFVATCGYSSNEYANAAEKNKFTHRLASKWKDSYCLQRQCYHRRRYMHRFFGPYHHGKLV